MTEIAEPETASLHQLTNGEIIAKLFDLRAEKLRQEEKIKPIFAEMQSLKTELIKRLRATDTISCKTARGSATVTTQRIPQMEDPEAFWNFVFDKRDRSLLSHSRPSAKACVELDAMAETPPGIGFIEITDISLRAA